MSIHGNDSYVNYKYEFNSQTPFVCLLICVTLSTACLVGRMAKIYCSKPMNGTKQVFKAFFMMATANFLFSFFDNLTFRIPSTGILTSWCASIEPNVYLAWIYIFQLFSAYWSLLFALLFSIVRVIIYAQPLSNEKIFKWLFPVYTIFSILFPAFTVFFLYTAKGYCRQWKWPYSFGAVFISYTDTIGDIRNDFIYFTLSMFIPIMIVVLNITLIFLGNQWAKKIKNGSNIFKAENVKTLYYTTIAMILPFAAHGTMAICGWLFPSVSGFVVVLRSPITELGEFAVPLIYTLTTPMFKWKKNNSVASAFITIQKI
uniref:Serpentine Receptor, class T n=2 Tax=Caenorhabditis tropicalis TaxID=1561998 RepID=A0A1I7U3Y7_9PELO